MMPFGTGNARASTTETRRRALEMATQLPDNADEARAVIEDLSDLLEGYLVKGPRPAWERNLLAAAEAASVVPCALFWTVAGMLVASPLAVVAHQLTGFMSAGALVLATCCLGLGLVFGPRCGLVAAGIAGLATNLLVVPPILALTWPTGVELVFLAAYLMTGALAPILARQADRLRSAAMSGAPRVPAIGRPTLAASEGRTIPIRDKSSQL